MALNLSPLNKSDEIRSYTGTDLGSLATGSLASYAKMKYAEKQEDKKATQKLMYEVFKDTPELTSESIINNSIMQNYSDVEKKWVKKYQDNKGILGFEDQMLMIQDFKSISSLANTLKTLNDDYNTARKTFLTESGQKRFDLRDDKYNQFLDGVKSGKVENIQAFLNDIKSSDTGFSFLDYKTMDPQGFVSDAAMDYQKATQKKREELSRTTESGDISRTVSTTEDMYGTDQDARNFFSRYLISNPNFEGIYKGIANSLSDQEKQTALFTYSGSKTPFIDYWIDNKLDTKKFIYGDISKKVETKPVSGTGKGKEKIINEENNTWDFRGDRKMFTPGQFTFYDDGKQVTENQPLAYATKLNYGIIPGTEKEGLYVSVVIPRPGSDVQLRLAMGEEVSQSELIKSVLSPDKSKEVYVPYDEIKDVLKDYNFENINNFLNRSTQTNIDDLRTKYNY